MGYQKIERQEIDSRGRETKDAIGKYGGWSRQIGGRPRSTQAQPHQCTSLIHPWTIEYVRLSVHECVIIPSRKSTESLSLDRCTSLGRRAESTFLYANDSNFGLNGDDKRVCVHVDKSPCCLCVRPSVCPSLCGRAQISHQARKMKSGIWLD